MVMKCEVRTLSIVERVSPLVMISLSLSLSLAVSLEVPVSLFSWYAVYIAAVGGAASEYVCPISYREDRYSHRSAHGYNVHSC